jgi:nickel/cobalt exporter
MIALSHYRSAFFWHRLLVMVLALASLGALVFLALTLWGSAPSPPPPIKHPFGTGLSEGGGQLQGLTGLISDWQSFFSREITTTLKEVTHNPQAALWLLVLSFIYGVVHAAGPGHGKAVIAAYSLASERALQRGVVMALGAALLQALVAIALVTVLAVVLRVTSSSMSLMAGHIERLSFAAVTMVGLALLWKKSGALVSLLAPPSHSHNPSHAHAHSHAHSHSLGSEACCHHHAPPVDDGASLRDMGMAVFAAGIRPCSGAILVLVFALSQKMFPLGIAAALVMASGTALTTGILAVLAVLAKNMALRWGGMDKPRTVVILRGVEILAAALVTLLGLTLLLSAP